jgi:hypothetical protein
MVEKTRSPTNRLVSAGGFRKIHDHNDKGITNSHFVHRSIIQGSQLEAQGPVWIAEGMLLSQRVTRTLFLLVLGIVSIQGVAWGESRVTSAPGIQPAEEITRSLEWLRSQVVPNHFITTPDPRRRGLILSYAPTLSRTGPIHRKAFIYDVALAAIAFSMAGDWTNASLVLNALVRVQRSDGSFWFSYNVENTWPEDGDHDMAVIRAGAMAWAGYALAFYLENRPSTNEPRALRERALFLSAARAVTDFLLTLRVMDSSKAQGLLRGGRATVLLGMDPRGTITESYEDQPIRWISTEHNISSYFLLIAMSLLTDDPRYRDAAHAIQSTLLAELWQDDLGQFAQGMREDGAIDRTRALDCASWGALFLFAIGEKDKMAQAMSTVDRVYKSEHRGIRGYRPYSEAPVYDNPRIERALLPDAPDVQWQNLPFVWSEGTLGVALGQLRLGNVARARGLLIEMLKLREGGGLQYASRELPYEFVGYPSVGGTAWHIIVEETLRNPNAPKVWAR